MFNFQFESPVVNAWRMDQGQLELVDLFGGKTPSLTDSSGGSNNVGGDSEEYDSDDFFPDSPALYVGMHKKQVNISKVCLIKFYCNKDLVVIANCTNFSTVLCNFKFFF